MILHSVPQVSATLMGQITAPRLLVMSDSLGTGPLWEGLLQQGTFDILLENDPDRVIRRCTEESPNVVLFETDDPGSVLLDLVRDLREGSNLPVILLTACKPEGHLLDAYESGIDECILKPISPALFHAKLNAWLRRSWAVPVNTVDPIQVGSVLLMPAERTVLVGERPPVRLTNLEMRLLSIIMNRPARTVTTEELIRRVWGYNSHADSTVLKNMIYRLRRKIEPSRSNPVIIQTVPGIGYKFAAE